MKITISKKLYDLWSVEQGQVFKFSHEDRIEEYPNIYMMSSSRDFIDLSNGQIHSTKPDSIYDTAQREDKVEILNAELFIG